jgi:large subunit ribosomal protein L30
MQLLRRAFSTTPSASPASGKFFKVKLFRGFIGLPDKYKEWARTLGLRKRGQTNYVPVMPVTMGAIIKMKELLKVDLVDERPEHNNPVYPKGYQVVDSYIKNTGKQ